MAPQDVQKYFFDIKQSVSSDWKDLAYHLGFNYADINNIAGRNRDGRSSCMDMLEEWQKREGNAATIGALMRALSDAHLRVVVDGLKRKYPELAVGQASQTQRSGSKMPVSQVSSEDTGHFSLTWADTGGAQVSQLSARVDEMHIVGAGHGRKNGKMIKAEFEEVGQKYWSEDEPCIKGAACSTSMMIPSEDLTPYFNVIAKKMSADWQELATNLGLPWDQIRKVKIQHSDPYSCCQEMLDQWRYNHDRQATVGDLIKAVKTTGNQDVAEKLEAVAIGEDVDLNAEDELKPYFDLIAKEMPADWSQLAVSLDVPFARIKAVKQENQDCWTCCYQILERWRSNNGRKATKEDLIKAVNETGHHDVAEKLEAMG